MDHDSCFVILYTTGRLFCAVSAPASISTGLRSPDLPARLLPLVTTRYLSLYTCFLYTSIHVRRNHSSLHLLIVRQLCANYYPHILLYLR